MLWLKAKVYKVDMLFKNYFTIYIFPQATLNQVHIMINLPSYDEIVTLVFLFVTGVFLLTSFSTFNSHLKLSSDSPEATTVCKKENLTIPTNPEIEAIKVFVSNTHTGVCMLLDHVR